MVRPQYEVVSTATRSILGHPVVRREDPNLITGHGRYVGDLRFEGMLDAAFARSPFAHAEILAIDTSGAAVLPGVIGVYTAAELDLPARHHHPLAPVELSRPILARSRIRCVGEPYAVVLAEGSEQAADAALAVILEAEPLPVVIDPVAALEPEAPLLFAERGTNLVSTHAYGAGQDVLAGAEVVIDLSMVNQRMAPVPMEPGGVVAVPEAGGLTLYASTQVPFRLRDQMAGALKLERERLRVIAPDVGGGFGAKIPVYAEYEAVAALALRLGRPVRWLETRSENLVNMVHCRGQWQRLQLGARRDGTITGMRVRVVADVGAYPKIAVLLPHNTGLMASGCYRIPAIDYESRTVVTNTPSMGAFRGAGRPEAATLIERAMDVLARRLGLDPVEVRRRNLIPRDRFPYQTATGASYDSGDYEALLDRALTLAGYGDLRREQAARRADLRRPQLGIGVGLYVEVTANNPTVDFAAVEVLEDGRFEVRAGGTANGQGHETTFAMLVAEELDVPMEQVVVVQSDTGRVERGAGSFGSRTVQVIGSAVVLSSRQIREKARRLAAHLLEVAPEDVVLENGRVQVAGVPARSLSWTELAAVARDPGRLPEGMEPGLEAATDFNQGAPTFPSGAHVAVVELDPETGDLRVLRHVAVDDCGRVINPLLVAGQVHGGIANGMAQALFEEIVFDPDGQLRTGSFLDYSIISANEMPGSLERESFVTLSPRNPLGAKGIGESGTIGSTPAVLNACIDALSPWGIEHLDMPLTPEKVWRAIAGRAGEARL